MSSGLEQSLTARVGRVVVACATGVVRLLEAIPTSMPRLVRAIGVTAVAATAVMSTAAACGFTDVECKANAWSEGVVEGLRATFSSLTHSMMQGIFTGSLGTLGAGSWTAGINLAGRVGAIMAIVVVALAAIQIITTLISKQREGILRAAIGAALAWPVTSAAVWAAMQLVQVIDAISNEMISDSHIATLSRLTDFTMAVGAASPLTAGLVALFFVFCVFIPTVLLSLIMAFRNYGIVLAVAIAPVSLMVWGFGSLRQMSRGWLKVVLALILTKPVLAIALVLAAELIVQSANNLEIGGFLTGLAGLAMAVFAPFAAMGMVSGAMAVADSNIMRGAEAGAGQFAGRLARSAGNKGKQAGHRTAEAAAMSNPKTAALWNFAHGKGPIPFKTGSTGSTDPTESKGSVDPPGTEGSTDPKSAEATSGPASPLSPSATPDLTGGLSSSEHSARPGAGVADPAAGSSGQTQAAGLGRPGLSNEPTPSASGTDGPGSGIGSGKEQAAFTDPGTAQATQAEGSSLSDPGPAASSSARPSPLAGGESTGGVGDEPSGKRPSGGAKLT